MQNRNDQRTSLVPQNKESVVVFAVSEEQFRPFSNEKTSSNFPLSNIREAGLKCGIISASLLDNPLFDGITGNGKQVVIRCLG